MKIDLSSLNKDSKSTNNSSNSTENTNLRRLRGIFTKQKGPARDVEGKFTSGRGGLTILKKFNWKRAAPLIGIVTLVGGTLVWRSLAATSLYPNQYSVYQCPGFNASSPTSSSCVSESAEAAVYSAYTSLLNREPDTGGYAYWVQQLAGDRVPLATVRASISKNPSTTKPTCTLDIPDKAPYTATWRTLGIPSGANWGTMLSRPGGNVSFQPTVGSATVVPPKGATTTYTLIVFDKNVSSTGAQNSWKTACSDNVKVAYEASREGKIIAALRQTSGNPASVTNAFNQIPAIGSLAATGTQSFNFLTFLKTAPRVSVTQTAKAKQDARQKGAGAFNSVSKREYETATTYVNATKSRVSASKNSAAKSKPSLADLNSISANKKASEADLVKAQKIATDTKNRFDGINKLYLEAKTVSDYSPDIPATAVKKELDVAIVYKVATEDYVNKQIKPAIGQIQGYYNSAKAKYDSQNVPPSTPPSDNPCNGVRYNSGSEKVKSCQRFLGVAADGRWGQDTENAFRAKFGKPSGWTPGSTPPAPSPPPAAACEKDETIVNGRCQPAWRSPSGVSCYQGSYPYLFKAVIRKGIVNNNGYTINAYTCKKNINSSENSASFRTFSCQGDNFYKAKAFGEKFYACKHN